MCGSFPKGEGMPGHWNRPVAAKSDQVPIGTDKGARSIKEQPVSRTKALERQEANAQAQITAPIVSTP
jgi:hypothetical protein